jgi:hypothetical protein
LEGLCRPAVCRSAREAGSRSRRLESDECAGGLPIGLLCWARPWTQKSNDPSSSNLFSTTRCQQIFLAILKKKEVIILVKKTYHTLEENKNENLFKK